jgi:pimeloyl-ACP methyl ester carboxylesterase
MRDQAKSYANSMQFFDFASLPPGYKTSIKPAQVYLATINGMIDEPVFDHLKLITQPTLIIFGEEDALIPHRILNPSLTQRSVAESGAKEIKGSKLVLFPNAGHYVHIERVGEVDKEIEGFVLNP